jgi:signal transduction histidine kinase
MPRISDPKRNPEENNPSGGPAHNRPIAGQVKKDGSLHKLLTDSALDALELHLQKPLQLGPVDLVGIITQEGTVLSAMSSELGVSLHFRIREDCVPILADFEKIRRSIAALIIHLLTFAQSQAYVTVVVESCEQKNKLGMSIRLSIDHLAVSWKPELTMEDGYSDPSEVTVCRRLVEMNGGSLAVQSKGESGISYSLWLPTKGPRGR